MGIPFRSKTMRWATRWSAALAAMGAVLAAASARAKSGGPDWAQGWMEEASASLAQESLVPPEYDRAELLALLLPTPLQLGEAKVECAARLLVKAWRASPGSSVAALAVVTHSKEPSSDVVESKTTVHVVVFAGGTAGVKPAPRARTTLDLPPERRLDELDLAPYRLARDKLALGVRTRLSIPYAGGGADNEYLSLLLPDGKQLQEVWSTLMSSSMMSNAGWNDDGSREKISRGIPGEATITVLKTQTRGLRDLRKTLVGHSAIYRWDGTRYQTDGDDPVEDATAE